MAVECDRARVVARLLQRGWISEGGTKHEKFSHPDKPAVKVMVPRHRTLSPGVARSIAKAAKF
jgi:predicted RNA binding protein YcfA (HicA-like mRNA interferase family)